MVCAGCELVGKFLRLIGFGASAHELALRAKAFGMRSEAIVLLRPATATHCATNSFSGTADALAEVLPRADFVSLHLPLTVDPPYIGRPQARALNQHMSSCRSGALVDEDALVRTLLSRLAGGLDFSERTAANRLTPPEAAERDPAPHVAEATT